MRLTIASLRRVVKGDLAIQFVPQALTSYGGLELLRRYLRRIDLTVRLRQAFAGLPSDYGSVRVALVVRRAPVHEVLEDVVLVLEGVAHRPGPERGHVAVLRGHLRADFEEDIMKRDDRYAAYAGRVRYRFVPGIR